MPIQRPLRLLEAAFMLIVLVGIVRADAFDPVFLRASDHQPTVRQNIRLERCHAATRAAQAAAWPEDGLERLFIRAGNTQENRHDVKPARAGAAALVMPIEYAGVTLVGTAERPVIVETAGRQLRPLAERSGSKAVRVRELPNDRETTRVRHITSAKLLVRTAGSDTASPIATAKTAQAAEIRPIADPTMVPVGSDLPMRVYVRGEKVVDVQVTATCVATGEQHIFMTDPMGTGYFRVSSRGEWRVVFQVLQPADKDDPKADWELYTGTLSFEVRKGADQ